MKKVLGFSLLLMAGLAGAQFLQGPAGASLGALRETVRLLTMTCLSFIMIHVGYEFEIDRSNLRRYAVDYGVAATAATFPWILCTLYFVFVFQPPAAWWHADTWTETLVLGRFAAPTSAGVLFSMLAAAGLSATWVFRKARILAIFDDVDTVLLMIPLKMLIVGARWQLAAIVLIMTALVWAAWRYLRVLRLPVTWPWVMGYAAVITVVSEAIYRASKLVDDVVGIHIEVLLPAFVLGCMLARPAGSDPHVDDAREGHQEGPEGASEQRVATLIAGGFMVLVGLSMPAVSLGGPGGMPWWVLLGHVLAVTVLANLGKMFPLFCYRSEVGWRERLALSIGMWPRGEVGAGILVVSLSYGLNGAMVSVASLSLALNLLATGFFIVMVKRLLA